MLPNSKPRLRHHVLLELYIKNLVRPILLNNALSGKSTHLLLVSHHLTVRIREDTQPWTNLPEPKLSNVFTARLSYRKCSQQLNSSLEGQDKQYCLLEIILCNFDITAKCSVKLHLSFSR